MTPDAETRARSHPGDATDPRPTLVYSVEIDAPAETVWRALTDPELTRQYFFGLSVRSSFEKGARFVLEVPDRSPRFVGVVNEVDPPVRLSVSVRLLRSEATSAESPSRITWEVEPLGERSRLTVIHDDFGDPQSPTLAIVSRGWPVLLEGLQELIENGSVVRAVASWPEMARARLPLDRA